MSREIFSDGKCKCFQSLRSALVDEFSVFLWWEAVVWVDEIVWKRENSTKHRKMKSKYLNNIGPHLSPRPWLINLIFRFHRWMPKSKPTTVHSLHPLASTLYYRDFNFFWKIYPLNWWYFPVFTRLSKYTMHPSHLLLLLLFIVGINYLVHHVSVYDPRHDCSTQRQSH